MNIKSVKCVYFGQAGSTKRISSAVGSVISEDVACLDLCGKAPLMAAFSEGDVLVTALPVSGGRLSIKAKKQLDGLSGNGAAAVAIVVCGGEGFGDALLELTDLLGAAGFSVVGAAAFVSDGAARPDDGDFSKLVEFASVCSRRLEELGGCCRTPEVPGARPYQKRAGATAGSFFAAFRKSSARPPKERVEPVWFA